MAGAARGVAAGVLARARAAADYARRTGCDIGEATEIVAAGAAGRRSAGGGEAGGVSRRSVLAGAGAVAVAGAIPAALDGRAAAASRAGDRAGGGRNGPRVVIVGSGLAGLGCAYRLWRTRGLRSEVYEYNADRIGGRVRTLRGFYAAGQYSELHGEFISTEHTQMRALAASFGLTLDNVNIYPAHTRALDYRLRFGGRFWSQAALDRDWHDWARELFLDAAVHKAPWPTLHDHYTTWGHHWDHMSATEWIERNIPGGIDSDFGRLCVAIVLDEYGGTMDSESALNLIYLLGLYDSSASGLQPKGYPQLSGTDEKWHIRHGNDQVVSGLHGRLPGGSVHLDHRLVALREHGDGTFTATFATGRATRPVRADHVVLALPFTKLREVELTGIDLPALQLRAIREEELGPNSKIGLQFSRRVWNADHWTGNLYTDGIVQGGWETTIDQPGPHGILIALPGGADGADIGRKYRLSSYEGPAPAAMAADYLRDFEVNFPGVSAAYNGKAYYAWSSGDPHVGGAYSYLKVGQYTGFNGVQGRRHGNLHFAGEHTSLNFQGYMEGALRSGYRCASEIWASEIWASEITTK
ncbi:MAG TPA: NAD(P)/FAD-dependent oxidoreductase [Streptosporangiaceae bacterium]|nr:NAD(P)/FAD-dependent oxidoreductase [Streptosporangiaceae bacterium]